jgi:hypothetical protein
MLGYIHLSFGSLIHQSVRHDTTIPFAAVCDRKDKRSAAQQTRKTHGTVVYTFDGFVQVLWRLLRRHRPQHSLYEIILSGLEYHGRFGEC